MKRIVALCLAAVLCVTMLSTAALAGEASPSKLEIFRKWKTVTTSETVFKTHPSITAPYAAGELTDEFLQSGITYLNYIRFVAGLPEVALDETMNADTQHAAVCMAANDVLSHYPDRPSGMTDEFYNRACAAASSSNIYSSTSRNAAAFLQRAVSGFMDDDVGTSNLSRVGHRRWLMNPVLGKVGFGYAASANKGFAATKVFDRSGAGIDYSFLAWPAAGNFPTNLMSRTTPWSVSLHPDKYQEPDRDSVVVKLTRIDDGTTWIFDKNSPDPLNAYEPFFNVDVSGRGLRNAIIFSPGADNISAYEGIWLVEVSGIRTAAGKAAAISYQVEFFDVENPTPFQDVDPGQFYFEPLLWALEEGITTGTSDTAFSPSAPCNRAQVVTFLWRSQGKPTVSTANPFTDVKTGDFYCDAVLWAVKHGITNGLSATEFGVNAVCNRAQIVTFLYRTFA